MMRRSRFLFSFLAVLTITACQSAGPEDNAVLRSLKWYSYLGGDDVRESCAAGGPDRLRFVYNGIWHEQVRTYDIVAVGPGARQESRVLGQGNIASIDLLDPFGVWRGPRVDTTLDAAAFATLRAAFDRAHAGARLKPGGYLRSDGYYWVAAECRAGRYRFAAWTTDESEVNTLPFVAPLLRQDLTEVPFRRAANPPQGPFRDYDPMTTYPHFRLQIDETGIPVGPRVRG